MAEERRQRLTKLPPHRRLVAAQIEQKTKDTSKRGEWFNVTLPSTLSDVVSEAFGATWLTAAFHAAGTLSPDNAVVSIENFVELDLQGDDAQGGAGQKAILTVQYAKPSPKLHNNLFIKVPWSYDVNPNWRTILSSQYGDGDGRELAVYVLAEDLIPVKIPRLYFADISRETTNYILILECIEYGKGNILPKSNKYQDHRLQDSHEYYYALMRALARVAAADKRGVFDQVIDSFLGHVKRRPPVDTHRRRLASQEWTNKLVDDLVEFQQLAPNIFPPEISGATFISKFRSQIVECSKYFTAASNWVESDERYTALCHVNLQIDNAYFWPRTDGEEGLEAGLLDWYNTTRVPFAQCFLGCFSGAEPAVLGEHIQGLMECFVAEYSKAGGPQISAEILLLHFQLLSVQGLVGSFSFIKSDIYSEGPHRREWRSIKSTDDQRVMGRWNVRCRTIAIIQQLRFWENQNLARMMLAWAQEKGIEDI